MSGLNEKINYTYIHPLETPLIRLSKEVFATLEKYKLGDTTPDSMGQFAKSLRDIATSPEMRDSPRILMYPYRLELFRSVFNQLGETNLKTPEAIAKRLWQLSKRIEIIETCTATELEEIQLFCNTLSFIGEKKQTAPLL